MIIGIGTDLVDIARIQATLAEHGERFVNRVFHENEQLPDIHDPLAPAHYAKRWAAKEAVAKALGVGVTAGVYLKDIIIEKSPSGAPMLHLVGGASDQACSLNQGQMPRLHLSLSDDGGYALAFVVVESD